MKVPFLSLITVVLLMASGICRATVASNEPRTSRSAVAQVRAFDEKFFVDGYLAKGHQDLRWHEDAMRLLRDQIDSEEYFDLDIVIRPEKLPANSALRAQAGRRIVDSGCDDAVVLWFCSKAFKDADQLADAKLLALRADAAAAKSAYSPICKMLILKTLIELDSDPDPTNQVIEERESRLATLVKSVLCDDELLPEFRSPVWAKLSFLYDDASKERFLKRMSRIEDVDHPDEWTNSLLIGMAEVKRAWLARGGSWASEVTDAQWSEFHTHLSKARSRFDTACKADSTLPHAYAMLVEVAMGEDDSNACKLAFDEAIKRQIDYGYAYERRFISLLPKWGGSYASIIETALEGVSTKRFDTRAPSFLLMAVDLIEKDNGGPLDKEIRDGLLLYVVEMLEGYIAQPADRPVVHWAKSWKAIWQFRCMKWNDARATLDSMKETSLMRSVLSQTSSQETEIRGQVYARSGKTAASVEKALAEPDPAKREKQFGEILTTLAKEDSAFNWIQKRFVTSHLEAKLAEGGWVNVSENQNLDDWWEQSGEWRVDGKGAVIGKSVKGMRLQSKFDVPERFELRCKVECLEGAGDTRKTSIWPVSSVDESICLRINVASHELLPVIDGKNFFAERLDMEGEVGVIHVRVEPKLLTFMRQDRPANSIWTKPVPEGTGRSLVLGAASTPPGTVWRFSEVQIRLIP